MQDYEKRYRQHSQLRRYGHLNSSHFSFLLGAEGGIFAVLSIVDLEGGGGGGHR